MGTFLEILKLTIPGLLVFGATYLLFKQYFDENTRVRQASLGHEKQKTILPLRLQAYERFTLLCERLAVQNILLRLREPEMTVRQLKMALLFGIQQEFEHNVAQQIYVSDTLWKIIRLAKEETQAVVLRAAEDLAGDADCQELVDAIFLEQQKNSASSPLDRALVAVRMEAAALFS